MVCVRWVGGGRVGIGAEGQAGRGGWGGARRERGRGWGGSAASSNAHTHMEPGSERGGSRLAATCSGPGLAAPMPLALPLPARGSARPTARPAPMHPTSTPALPAAQPLCACRHSVLPLVSAGRAHPCGVRVQGGLVGDAQGPVGAAVLPQGDDPVHLQLVGHVELQGGPGSGEEDLINQ